MVPTKTLVGIVGFVFVSALTLFFWIDRWRGVESPVSEAFADTITQGELNRLAANLSSMPTDDDAIQAHQTLLRYISNDFNKGIKFVLDFGQRFYGDNLPLRQDLDTRTLMDNYRSPLQRV
jgi:hypothetical protein